MIVFLFKNPKILLRKNLFIIFIIVITIFLIFFKLENNKIYENTNEIANNVKYANTLVENEITTNYESNLFKIENLNKSENKEIIEEINNIWILEIPRINLVANISEGTSKEVLDNYIGHFEETRKRLWKYSTCCT